jgi:glycosyltransferase involved in cell wall biosynthesis
VDLQRELGISPSAFIIGFTGVIRPWHGLEVLVEAVAGLLKQGKDVFLLIVGDGPVRESLLSSFHEKGLEKSAVITGRIPYKDVPDYVSLFDIAVSPGSTFYASPMKVVEYMSLSKATIVPCMPNFLDIIDDEVNGLVFEKDCAKSLELVLNRLCNEDELLRVIGREARNKVETRLNWIWNAKEVINFAKDNEE